MLLSLRSTENGKSWIRNLPDAILEELDDISQKLIKELKPDNIIPSAENCLAPFHFISFDKVKIVMICKEPYSGYNMATGIPIETASGFETDSVKTFKTFIKKFHSNVTDDNFMKLYYKSGILTINASFTCTYSSNKKYALSNSHFPLWAPFVSKLVGFFNTRKIPILALGSEARMLFRDLTSTDNNLYECAFPSDKESKREFDNILYTLFFRYVIQTCEPSEV